MKRVLLIICCLFGLISLNPINAQEPLVLVDDVVRKDLSSLVSSEQRPEGRLRVAVAIFSLDTNSTNISREDVESLFNDEIIYETSSKGELTPVGKGVSAFFYELSNNSLSLETEVFDGLVIQAPAQCDRTSIHSLLERSMVEQTGINTEDYDIRYFIVPSMGCAIGGIADAIGQWSGPDARAITFAHRSDLSHILEITIHELGHVFGFHHAKSISVDNDNGNSSTIRYGDSSDFMGGGIAAALVNVPHRLQLNWGDLEESGVLEVVDSGLYNLSDLDGHDTNLIKALKINSPNSAISSFISYRPDLPYSSFTNGRDSTLDIHIHEITARNGPTYLKAKIDSQQGFFDPRRGFHISKVSGDGSSALVRVTNFGVSDLNLNRTDGLRDGDFVNHIENPVFKFEITNNSSQPIAIENMDLELTLGSKDYSIIDSFRLVSSSGFSTSLPLNSDRTLDANFGSNDFIIRPGREEISIYALTNQNTAEDTVSIKLSGIFAKDHNAVFVNFLNNSASLDYANPLQGARVRILPSEHRGPVDLITVENLQPNSTTFETRPLISWDANKAATAYDLRIESLPSGDRVIRLNLEENHYRLTSDLVPGHYRLRVRARNSAGWGEYSRAFFSVITEEDEIPQVVQNIAMDSSLALITWDAQDNVDWYEVRVEEQPNGRRILREFYIRDNQYSLPDNLEPGRYRIRVRASNRVGQGAYGREFVDIADGK